MSKDDKLVETLISATERNKVVWNWLDEGFIEYLSETYKSSKVLVHEIDKDSTFLLVKYGSVEEKVDLLLFDRRRGVTKPTLEIVEEDIETPHRLWTLYKLADRNASGTDKIIDNIISKYSNFSF